MRSWNCPVPAGTAGEVLGIAPDGFDCVAGSPEILEGATTREKRVTLKVIGQGCPVFLQMLLSVSSEAILHLPFQDQSSEGRVKTCLTASRRFPASQPSSAFSPALRLGRPEPPRRKRSGVAVREKNSPRDSRSRAGCRGPRHSHQRRARAGGRPRRGRPGCPVRA